MTYWNHKCSFKTEVKQKGQQEEQKGGWLSRFSCEIMVQVITVEVGKGVWLLDKVQDRTNTIF